MLAFDDSFINLPFVNNLKNGRVKVSRIMEKVRQRGIQEQRLLKGR
jgi:hypothetical protein